jgi:hypothetical protein
MRVRVVIVCAVVLASGCKGKVDTKDLEETLRRRTTALGLHATGISCPPDVEATPGRTFVCEVALDATHRYALNVTVGARDHATDEVNLDTAWRDGEAIQCAKLGAAMSANLSKSFATEVVVTCGDEPLRFLDAQRQLSCAVSAGNAKSVATIDFNAGLEVTEYHLSPALLTRTKLEEVLTRSVRGQTTADASVDCGSGVLLVRPADGSVWCGISSAGRKAKIKVDIDDELNVTHWEVAEPPG